MVVTQDPFQSILTADKEDRKDISQKVYNELYELEQNQGKQTKKWRQTVLAPA